MEAGERNEDSDNHTTDTTVIVTDRLFRLFVLLFVLVSIYAIYNCTLFVVLSSSFKLPAALPTAYLASYTRSR